MGLFGRGAVGGRGEVLPPFELWGQRGWPSVDVVGESYHSSAIRALLPSKVRLDSAEVTVPVSVSHDAVNKHDQNAVAIVASTGLVGYLSREDAARYAPVLAALQADGWSPTTLARVWGYDGENWDTGKVEFRGSVRVDLAEPHMLVPANDAPLGASTVLPIGSAIQVSGEEENMPAILPFLNAHGECWAYATLHEVQIQGSRSSKTLCEVRLDAQVVGRLTPKMSGDVLPVVSFLAQRGRLTCVRVIVKGNALKAEVVLYSARASQLTAGWFETVPDGVGVTGEAMAAPAVNVDERRSQGTATTTGSTAPTASGSSLRAGPPADWYADPYGAARLRYWSGSAWTEHVAD